MPGTPDPSLLNTWFPPAPAGAPAPKPVRSLGVIGVGPEGTGIAHWCATRGLGVILHDPQAVALTRAVALIREHFNAAEMRGEISHAAAHKAVGGIGITTSVEDLEFCDVIVETIVEDLASKRARLATLARALPRDVVFGTAASAAGIEELFAGVEEPGRLIGIGFLEPVHASTPMRITVGSQTSRTTAERILGLAATLAKTPIVHGGVPRRV